MSTTLLYNMFGIRGYEYRQTDFIEGRACFTVEQPRERYRCSGVRLGGGACPRTQGSLLADACPSAGSRPSSSSRWHA